MFSVFWCSLLFCFVFPHIDMQLLGPAGLWSLGFRAGLDVLAEQTDQILKFLSCMHVESFSLTLSIFDQS